MLSGQQINIGFATFNNDKTMLQEAVLPNKLLDKKKHEHTDIQYNETLDNGVVTQNAQHINLFPQQCREEDPKTFIQSEILNRIMGFTKENSTIRLFFVGHGSKNGLVVAYKNKKTETISIDKLYWKTLFNYFNQNFTNSKLELFIEGCNGVGNVLSNICPEHHEFISILNPNKVEYLFKEVDFLEPGYTLNNNTIEITSSATCGIAPNLGLIQAFKVENYNINEIKKSIENQNIYKINLKEKNMDTQNQFIESDYQEIDNCDSTCTYMWASFQQPGSPFDFTLFIKSIDQANKYKATTSISEFHPNIAGAQYNNLVRRIHIRFETDNTQTNSYTQISLGQAVNRRPIGCPGASCIGKNQGITEGIPDDIVLFMDIEYAGGAAVRPCENGTAGQLVYKKKIKYNKAKCAGGDE